MADHFEMRKGSTFDLDELQQEYRTQWENCQNSNTVAYSMALYPNFMDVLSSREIKRMALEDKVPPADERTGDYKATEEEAGLSIIHDRPNNGWENLSYSNGAALDHRMVVSEKPPADADKQLLDSIISQKIKPKPGSDTVSIRRKPTPTRNVVGRSGCF